jgi:uncharacterized membrane protein YeiH
VATRASVSRAHSAGVEKRVSPASARLLLVLDLLGIFVFAVEGAMVAGERGLDALGILVLSFATALGGGLMRDVLIGAIPPAAIADWRYAATAFAGGGMVFCLYEIVLRVPVPVVTALDAAGLGMFAVVGTEKALLFGIHPFIAVLMGGITGAGGGTLRDLLLGQSPTVLHSDIYAVAALLAGVVIVAGRRMGMRPAVAAWLGAVLCFTLRLVAVWRHWNLPRLN